MTNHLPRSRFAYAVLSALTCLGLAACDGVPSSDNSSDSAAITASTTGTLVGLAGKCLDARAGASANGTVVQLYTCNGSAAQKWTFSNGELLGPGGKCLDATGNASANGTKLELWDCHGGANQKWTLQSSGELTGINGQCVDVTVGNSADSTPVELWSCWGGDNQKWKLSGSSSGGTDAGTPAHDAGTVTPPPSGQEQPNGISGTWTRTFTEEFNSTTLDRNKWTDTWFGGDNFNGTVELPSNIVLDGNYAIMKTSSSAGDGAMLSSNPNGGAKTGFQLGTGAVLEARISFAGNGTTIYNWPAFWTGPQSWPAGGEVDIFEGLGRATSNYHSNNGANNSGTIAGTWSNAFHTYAVLREVGHNYIYWDGKLVRDYVTYDNGALEYILLTSGGNTGATVVTGSAADMKVDYVRAWKR